MIHIQSTDWQQWLWSQLNIFQVIWPYFPNLLWFWLPNLLCNEILRIVIADTYYSISTKKKWTIKEHRKNWARLIRGLIWKIYQVDPLTCAKCGGRMRILSFIEYPEIIKKILKHLDLWNLKGRPTPRANAPPNTTEPHLDYSDSQLPPTYDYLYVDEQYPEGPSA